MMRFKLTVAFVRYLALPNHINWLRLNEKVRMLKYKHCKHIEKYKVN